MSDPLEMARDEGAKAAVQILEDLISTGDRDECVRLIRVAASIDTKFNWHLIEVIAAYAAMGLAKSRQS